MMVKIKFQSLLDDFSLVEITVAVVNIKQYVVHHSTTDQSHAFKNSFIEIPLKTCFLNRLSMQFFNRHSLLLH